MAQVPTNRRADRGTRKRHAKLVTFLVGAVVVVVAYVTRLSPGTLDSWHYVLAGIEFPQDSWVALGYTRYGLVLPLGLVSHVLGGNTPGTHYVEPFLAVGLLAAGIFALARRWFGVLTGLLAVLLTFVGPLVWDSVTIVYPDIPSIALVVWAIVLVQAAGDTPGRRRALAFLLAAGFLLGWAFEVRETTLVCWPFVVWAARTAGVPWRRLLLLLPGMSAWAALDIGISAAAYGDPLLKLHVLLGQDLDTVASANNDYLGRPRSYYLTIVPKMLLDPGVIPGGVWVLVVWVVAALAVFVPRPRARLVGIWFLVTVAVFVLQGGLLAPDHPAVRLLTARYWIAFAVPGALAAATVLGWAAGRLAAATPRMPRTSVAVVAVGLLAVPIFATARELATEPVRAPNGGLVFADVRSYLHAHPPAPGARVWTDYYAARLLSVYSRNTFGGTAWSAPVLSVYAKNVTRKTGDLVVFIQGGCQPCTQYLSAFEANRRNEIAGWQVAYRAANGTFTVYRVP